MSKPRWMREVDEEKKKMEAESTMRWKQAETRRRDNSKKFQKIYRQWNGRVKSELKALAKRTLGGNFLGMRWSIKGGVDERNGNSCDWGVYSNQERVEHYSESTITKSEKVREYHIYITETNGEFRFNHRYELSEEGLNQAMQELYREGSATANSYNPL